MEVGVGATCVICGDPTGGGAYCSRECRGADFALYRQHADQMLAAFEVGLPRPVIDWRIKEGDSMAMVTVAHGTQWSLIGLADHWRGDWTTDQVARLCDVVKTIFECKSPAIASVCWILSRSEVSCDVTFRSLITNEVLNRWRREAIREVREVMAGEDTGSSFAEDILGVLDTD